jgi:hypothetical protein
VGALPTPIPCWCFGLGLFDRPSVSKISFRFRFSPQFPGLLPEELALHMRILISKAVSVSGRLLQKVK